MVGPGLAGSAGVVRALVWRSVAGLGIAGLAILARQGEARLGPQAGHVAGVWRGNAGEARQIGGPWFGFAGWTGLARPVRVGLGIAGKVWLIAAWRGMETQAWQGLAWRGEFAGVPGSARRGMARLGRPGSARNCRRG